MAHNKLTPAQAERLAWLAEELAEAGQRVNKILRHGYDNHHPDKKHYETNRRMLELELGDVSAATQLLFNRGDLVPVQVYNRKKYKLKTVWEYLYHNKKRAIDEKQ